MRSSSRIVVCCSLLVVLHHGKGLLAELPPSVGEFGDFRRLVVEGNASFTAGGIQQALAGDFDVAVAAHPLAPLSDYLRVLESRCRDGYRRHGFPQATVRATFDDATGKIALAIVEGQQLKMGDVVIAGARRMDVVGLREALLRSASARDPLQSLSVGDVSDREKSTAPLWRPSEPTDFSPQGQAARTQGISNALATRGFHHCIFEARLTTDFDSGKANLHIDLIDEGAPALVSDVVVTGLQRNTRDALLREIQWRDDRLITSTELDRISARLLQSGRFIGHSVRIAPPDDQQRRFRLLIDVVEYSRATPLGQPLSEIEQVLLKHARWFNDVARQNVDLLMHVSDGEHSAELIISPRNGMLLREHADGESSPAKLAVVFGADRWAYYVADHDQKFEMPSPGWGIAVRGWFGFNDAQEREEFPFRFKFSGDFTTRAGVDEPVVSVQLVAEPAQCLATAYEHDAKCTLHDGILTIDSKSAVARYDAATGQLLQYNLRRTASDSQCELTFVAGAFEAAERKLRAAARFKANAYDAKHVARSLTMFAVSEPSLRAWRHFFNPKGPHDAPILEAPLRSALEKIIAGGACDALDGLAHSQPHDDAASFRLPTESNVELGAVKQYARLFLPTADIVFPRQSWAATLYRETCLTLSGRADYMPRELTRLHESPVTGPVCALSTAALTSAINPAIGKRYATLGLARLSVADFRNDYEPLLDEQSLAGIAAQQLLEALRTFNDAERDALGRLLVGEHVDEFVAATRLMRENPDRSASELLPFVLDRWWEFGLRDTVEQALREYLR